MTRLKIGLVGAGRRSAAHLPVIAALSDRYELVGVADVEAAAATTAAAPYAVPAFDSVERLLAEAQPDVVDITVPTDGHHVIAAAALAGGAHLLVEAPIALSLPCADRMIAAAAHAQRKLEVCENVWRFPEERMKRAILESGLLGDPLRGYVVLSAASPHAMNALRAYTGFDVAAIEAWAAGQEWPLPLPPNEPARSPAAEEWQLGLLRFANGTAGLYEWTNTASTPLRSHVPRYYRVDATRGAIVNADVYLCRDGGTRLYMMEKETREDRGLRVLDAIRVGPEPLVEWINPLRHYRLTAGHLALASALVGLHHAIVDDAEPEYGARNARADLELAIALEESIRRRAPVALPLSGPTQYEEELHARFRERYGREALDLETPVQSRFRR
jgi:predicted dehydrogenase